MTDPNETTHPGPPEGWPLCDICGGSLVEPDDDQLEFHLGDMDIKGQGQYAQLCRVHMMEIERAMQAVFDRDGLLNRAKVKATLLRLGASEHALHSDGYWMGVRACCKALKLPMPSKPKGDTE